MEFPRDIGTRSCPSHSHLHSLVLAPPLLRPLLRPSPGRGRGRKRWEGSAGEGGGVAASGRREGRAGFCRAASSSRSRPSPRPAAVKSGLAKLGVALTPSHWHVLSATSAHSAAAADSSLGPATFLTPRAPFNHHQRSCSLHTGLQRPSTVRPVRSTGGDERIRHPSSP